MDPMVWLLKNRIGSLELSRQVGPNLLRGLMGSILLHVFVVSSFFVMTMIHAGDHTKIGKTPLGPIEVVPFHPVIPVLPPIVHDLPHPKLPDVVTHPIASLDDPTVVDVPTLTPPGKIGVPGEKNAPGTGTNGIDQGKIDGLAGILPPDEFPPDTQWIARELEPAPLDINPTPRYPDLARRAGMSGKVVMRVFVDQQGTARKWHVDFANPADLGFEDEVLNVIPKWKFTPAIQQGNPIGVWVSIPFVFKYQK